MTKGKFVKFLKDYLLQWRPLLVDRDVIFEKLLKRLFDEIDISNKNYITWEEFNEFLINQASTINKHIVTKEVSDNHLYTPIEMKCNKRLLETTHRAFDIPELEMIALVQDKHSIINFISYKDGSSISSPLDISSRITQDASLKFSKDNPSRKSVLGLIYIPEYSLLIVSTEDKVLSFWQYHITSFVNFNTLRMNEATANKGVIECKMTQSYLVWDEHHKVLYSAQEDGVINLWSIKKECHLGVFEGSKDELDIGRIRSGMMNEIIRHENAVTDLILLPKLFLLASASLDQTVILWDTISKRAKRVYIGHKKGVNALAYSEELVRLFSAGYDHDICIWNPYANHLVQRISGHSNAVVSLKIIENLNQLISGDIDGLIKVWELNTMTCKQTINTQLQIESFKPDLQQILILNNKILAIGQKLVTYIYASNYNPKLASTETSLCIELNKDTLELIVPVNRSVKIWDALTGKIKRVYKDLSKAEITLFKFDGKRFIIGDAEGNTIIYNYYTGFVIKTLSKHCGPLTAIALSHNLIYTGSIKDKEIMIHDDKIVNKSIKLRTISNENHFPVKFDVTNKGHIVIGFTSGIIKVYESDASHTICTFSAGQSVSFSFKPCRK